MQDIEVMSGMSIDEVFDKIADLEYMIAMRFHAVIASLMAGIKTSAINYDIKVEKLAQEASIPLISMKSHRNDYKKIFTLQKSLNSAKLSDLSISKQFDWSDIEKLFTE